MGPLAHSEPQAWVHRQISRVLQKANKVEAILIFEMGISHEACANFGMWRQNSHWFSLVYTVGIGD